MFHYLILILVQWKLKIFLRLKHLNFQKTFQNLTIATPSYFILFFKIGAKFLNLTFCGDFGVEQRESGIDVVEAQALTLECT